MTIIAEHIFTNNYGSCILCLPCHVELGYKNTTYFSRKQLTMYNAENSVPTNKHLTYFRRVTKSFSLSQESPIIFLERVRNVQHPIIKAFKSSHKKLLRSS